MSIFQTPTHTTTTPPRNLAPKKPCPKYIFVKKSLRDTFNSSHVKLSRLVNKYQRQEGKAEAEQKRVAAAAAKTGISATVEFPESSLVKSKSFWSSSACTVVGARDDLPLVTAYIAAAGPMQIHTHTHTHTQAERALNAKYARVTYTSGKILYKAGHARSFITCARVCSFRGGKRWLCTWRAYIISVLIASNECVVFDCLFIEW